MSTYSEFFFGWKPNVVQLQLIEITHSTFTTFRVCRNCGRDGILAFHEGATGPFVYQYRPMKIESVGSGADLEQAIEITVGDLGQTLPDLLESISSQNAMDEKPLVIYREYSSEDVDSLGRLQTPIYGPLQFRIDAIAFNKTGAVLRAKAAAFDVGRIGVYYTTDIFPMLKNAG